MEKRALALCGGGAKGAYHIGAWKAFEEEDIRFDAVSGASVGSLNALLYAICDYETAKDIWLSVRPEQFMSPGKSGEGLFSRDGLKKIFSELDFSLLKTSMPVYVNIYNVSRNRSEAVKLNSLPRDRVEKYLLASSSVPVVYGIEKINDMEYQDPGFGFNTIGNVPIDILYRRGYRNISVVALNNNFSIYSLHNCFGMELCNNENRIIIEKAYPKAEFEQFIPNKDIGMMFEFKPTDIRTRILNGYRETKKILNKETGIFMQKNINEINLYIRKKFNQIFKSKKQLEEFIRITDFGTLNVETGTMGGNVCYKNIVEMYGYRLQWHTFLLKNHYRILDENNRRVAWCMDPDIIITALESYENSRNDIL